jgi:hypothetical protein
MTTFPTRTTGTSAGRTTGTSAGRPPRPAGTRPVSAWAFAGVAVSIAGVMLVEYLALSRLSGAVASWPPRFCAAAHNSWLAGNPFAPPVRM